MRGWEKVFVWSILLLMCVAFWWFIWRSFT